MFKINKKILYISIFSVSFISAIGIGIGFGIQNAKNKKESEYKDWGYTSSDSLTIQQKLPINLNVVSFEKFAWYDIKTNPEFVSLILPNSPSSQTIQIFNEFGESLYRLEKDLPSGDTPDISIKLFDLSIDKNEIGTIKVKEWDKSETSPSKWIPLKIKLLFKNGTTRIIDLKTYSIKKTNFSVTLPFSVFKSLQDQAYSIWEKNFYQKNDSGLNLGTNNNVQAKINELSSDAKGSDGSSLYLVEHTIKDELLKMYHNIKNSKSITNLKVEIDAFFKDLQKKCGKEFADAFRAQATVVHFEQSGSTLSPTPVFQP